MALKTSVKVGSITNLSDARYCAGMGVEFLGFRTVEGQEHYINPVQYQEIRGWFVGPKVVAEIYGLTHQPTFESIINYYQPDLIELSCHDLLKLRPKGVPIILSLDAEQFHDKKVVFRDFKDEIKYLQLAADIDKSLLSEIADQFKVFLELTDEKDFDSSLIREDHKIGFALKGSPEEISGFKSYEKLSDIFEQLEVD